MGFKVYKQECKNCLLSNNSIVSPERRKEIIEEIKKDQSFFICHNATINQENICCQKFYKKLGHTSNIIRIAERLNFVEFVDQDNDSSKFTSFINQK